MAPAFHAVLVLLAALARGSLGGVETPPLPPCDSAFTGTFEQSSVTRSGSTVIFNILRLMFPRATVKKDHWTTISRLERAFRASSGTASAAHSRIITTVRHPLDSLVSEVQTRGHCPTTARLRESYDIYALYGGRSLVWLTSEQNLSSSKTQLGDKLLALEYERFASDVGHAVSTIERFMRCRAPEHTRARIERTLNARAVRASIGKLNFTGFHEYDPGSHWHGGHIAEQPTDFCQVLPPRVRRGMLAGDGGRRVVQRIADAFYRERQCLDASCRLCSTDWDRRPYGSTTPGAAWPEKCVVSFVRDAPHVREVPRPLV
jgi:hypothetical protein